PPAPPKSPSFCTPPPLAVFTLWEIVPFTEHVPAERMIVGPLFDVATTVAPAETLKEVNQRSSSSTQVPEVQEKLPPMPLPTKLSQPGVTVPWACAATESAERTISKEKIII